MGRKYEYWQPSINTFYMPWATDLLPDEINIQIEKVKQQFKKKFGVDGYAISAVTGKQLQDLLIKVADKIIKSKEEKLNL